VSPSRRILIVAAPSLREALVEQLARHPEFTILDAGSIDAVETIIAAGALDILLLDAEIGLALAASARRRFRGPVFLIGGGEPPAPAIIKIARPFRFADLLLRLRAASETAAREVVIGARRFQPGAFELTDADGRRLPLTEKEAAILTRLVDADGEIVTKEILLRDIWGYRPDVTTRTLETHLSRLRRKIGAPARLLAEGNGYRLVFRRRSDDEAAETAAKTGL
jgi:DNA-binding winged helix-turn-helix (wHTH) protein